MHQLDYASSRAPAAAPNMFRPPTLKFRFMVAASASLRAKSAHGRREQKTEKRLAASSQHAGLCRQVCGPW